MVSRGFETSKMITLGGVLFGHVSMTLDTTWSKTDDGGDIFLTPPRLRGTGEPSLGLILGEVALGSAVCAARWRDLGDPRGEPLRGPDGFGRCSTCGGGACA